MRPVSIDGKLWMVERVPPSSPLLVDRTGTHTLATTDPVTRTISISNAIIPPMLDMVLMHELSHAAMSVYGYDAILGKHLDDTDKIPVEEWAVGFMEKHGIEVALAASSVLGRPACANGYCLIV